MLGFFKPTAKQAQLSSGLQQLMRLISLRKHCTSVDAQGEFDLCKTRKTMHVVRQSLSRQHASHTDYVVLRSTWAHSALF